MMAKDKASLQKEIITMDTNRRRRAIFQDTWRSPVPGHTPTAPALEGGPSVGVLLAGLGVSALCTIGKDWFKGANPPVGGDSFTVVSENWTDLGDYSGIGNYSLPNSVWTYKPSGL
jgi:hypothetical protein